MNVSEKKGKNKATGKTHIIKFKKFSFLYSIKSIKEKFNFLINKLRKPKTPNIINDSIFSGKDSKKTYIIGV